MECVAACYAYSPSGAVQQPSWLTVLLSAHSTVAVGAGGHTRRTVELQSTTAASSPDISEPRPQQQGAMDLTTSATAVSGWQDGSSVRIPERTASPGVDLSTNTAGNTSKTRARSPTSKLLARRALVASSRRDETNQEHHFWLNRLKLLRRELESAEQEHIQNKTAVANHTKAIGDAIRAQLDEEHERSEAIRRERYLANRIQRDAHHQALRDAFCANLAAKRINSERRRKERADAAIQLEEQRSREQHRRHTLKEAVQQEKVIQMLRRTRERAMKAEETRRLYEQRISQVEAEERTQQDATAELIHQTSKIVQRLRMLREQQPSVGSESESLS